LALAPGAVVLDVGCGTGASALPAAEIVGPRGRVVGVDLAERLLAIARGKAESQGLANVEFRTGDMERLGYPDGHFDAVVSVFSIFFVEDMVKQLRELWPWSARAASSRSPPGVRACSSPGPRIGGPR